MFASCVPCLHSVTKQKTKIKSPIPTLPSHEGMSCNYMYIQSCSMHLFPCSPQLVCALRVALLLNVPSPHISLIIFPGAFAAGYGTPEACARHFIREEPAGLTCPEGLCFASGRVCTWAQLYLVRHMYACTCDVSSPGTLWQYCWETSQLRQSSCKQNPWPCTQARSALIQVPKHPLATSLHSSKRTCHEMHPAPSTQAHRHAPISRMLRSSTATS